MDDERFDAVIRALGNGVTRRGALGLLAGMAGLGLTEAAAKGRRTRKAKKRRRGRVQAAANRAGKVTLCHHDQDTDTWHPIRISAKAVDKHKANHGDFPYDPAAGECCTNADCALDATCVIGTGAGSCEPICPGSAACNCPPGRTVCDAIEDPQGVAKCDNGCFCAERADGHGSVCWGRFGDCFTAEEEGCTKDADCPTIIPGLTSRCVKFGDCAVGDCVPEKNFCVTECADAPETSRAAPAEIIIAD